MSALEINSKTEIANVYHKVIQDVIKKIKDVFNDEHVSHFVLNDLESLWTTKFLKMCEKTLPVITVPMKVMVPFKKTPASKNVQIREIELMVPHHEAKHLDLCKIFPENIMDDVVDMSDEATTMYLQQRINNFLLSKDQVDKMIFVEDSETMEKDDDSIVVDEELLDDPVTTKEPPFCEDEDFPVPQLDGGPDSSNDDSSDDSSSSQKTQENVDQNVNVSDGETLNSDDDVTDEDIETLFDCDNVILCQYLKVVRSKNMWRFYFKDAIMNLNGCDYAFHKIFGDAPW